MYGSERVKDFLEGWSPELKMYAETHYIEYIKRKLRMSS